MRTKLNPIKLPGGVHYEDGWILVHNGKADRVSTTDQEQSSLRRATGVHPALGPDHRRQGACHHAVEAMTCPTCGGGDLRCWCKARAHREAQARHDAERRARIKTPVPQPRRHAPVFSFRRCGMWDTVSTDGGKTWEHVPHANARARRFGQDEAAFVRAYCSWVGADRPLTSSGNGQDPTS